MKKAVLILFMTLLFLKVSAQEGFRAEVNVGPTVGDANEYFSYVLQGNIYYLWNIGQTIDVGLTTGVIVFLGEGNNYDGSSGLFGSIPDVFLPIAVTPRVHFSELIFTGVDIGYALSANAFGSSSGDVFEDGNGGFYFRPLLGFSIKEKLALIISYSSINEKYDNSSMVSLGVNFGF